MRIPSEPSFDGDDEFDDGAPRYEWLDEWLCEYVDGTMDPSLEAVFEKYVEANPELKAHVERLRQTRELLCDCGQPESPSTDTKSEVCSEVEEDLLQSSAPLSALGGRRPLTVMGVVSSVATALVVGFLAGSILVDPATLSPSSSASPVSPTEQGEPAMSPVVPHGQKPAPALRLEEASGPNQSPLVPPRSAESVPGSDTTGRPSALTAIEPR